MVRSGRNSRLSPGPWTVENRCAKGSARQTGGSRSAFCPATLVAYHGARPRTAGFFQHVSAATDQHSGFCHRVTLQLGSRFASLRANCARPPKTLLLDSECKRRATSYPIVPQGWRFGFIKTKALPKQPRNGTRRFTLMSLFSGMNVPHKEWTLQGGESLPA